MPDPQATEAPRPSALEHHAHLVAGDVTGEPEEGEKGVDFAIIVITILQTVIQKCPLPQAAKAKALRKPGIRQRAALLKAAKEHCDCCNQGQHAYAVYRSMLARASALSDADAAALVDEGASDANLLI